MSWQKDYLRRALRKKHRRAPRRLRRQLYPELIEAEYARELDDFVAFIKRRVDQKIKPLLPGLAKYYARERKDADDPLDDVDTSGLDLAAIIAAPQSLGDLADELKAVRLEVTTAYTPEELARLARLTGKSVESWNERQMQKQIGSIVELDLFGSEPWLAREMGAFVTQNTSLITSLPDEYLSQVEKIVSVGVRNGRRWEDISADLEDRYDVAKSRANLIARDQIGKFNGQLTELRQKDLGIDKYTWVTSGDARVRETHQENAKRDSGFGPGVYEWSDPPDTGHPGEDYQCRCWAEPVLDNFFEDDA